ncbi:MAG: YicC/YloC family endoribonuclease, partial [Polyangia bacterium]|nr:YicC/YloC family endoribonuclease [Polyangia bacterium]
MTDQTPIFSMTGFGSQSFEVAGVAYFLELRSVNGRHQEVRVRLPWPAPLLEARLGGEARAAFHRGRLDLLLRSGAGERGSDDDGGGASAQGQGRTSGLRLREAHRELEQVVAELGLGGSPEVRDLIAYAELLDREDPTRRGPPQGLLEAASAALALALEGWSRMRATEGAALGRKIHGLLGAVEAAVGALEGLAAEQ